MYLHHDPLGQSDSRNADDTPSLTLSDNASDLLNQHSHLNLTNQIEFTDYDIRGCGGFSDVYYGRFVTCNKYVAIKRLRVHMQREVQLSKNIARELRIWASLTHPNVLPLLGYIFSHSATFAFISEWMDNGTVRDFLRKYPDTDRIEIVKGIATGLLYLHEQKVIHSDVKSDNVLVSSAGIPMLSDFGVSSVFAASQVNADTTSFKGSVRWMAIEFYEQIHGTSPGTMVKANEKTDVWAFGMTVYEILTGKRPFEHITNDVIAGITISNGQLPSAPEDIDSRSFLDQRLWSLCQQCWIKSPIERPSMQDVLNIIPSQWKRQNRECVIDFKSQAKVKIELVLEMKLCGVQFPVQGLQFSADGNYLAMFSAYSVGVVDIKKGGEIFEFTTPALNTALCFHPNEKYIFISKLNGDILVWDFERGQVHQELAFHSSSLNSEAKLNISNDGKLLLYDQGTWRISGSTNTEVKMTKQNLHGRHSTSFSPDNRLVTAWKDNVEIWDVPSEKPRMWFKHPDCVSSIAFSPDGDHLFTSSRDGTIKIWKWGLMLSDHENNVQSQSSHQQIFNSNWAIHNASLSHSGHWIVCAAGRHQIWILDVAREELSATLQPLHDGEPSFALHPMQNVLAMSGRNGHAVIWKFTV